MLSIYNYCFIPIAASPCVIMFVMMQIILAIRNDLLLVPQMKIMGVFGNSGHTEGDTC